MHCLEYGGRVALRYNSIARRMEHRSCIDKTDGVCERHL